jgi:hypothetical protein
MWLFAATALVLPARSWRRERHTQAAFALRRPAILLGGGAAAMRLA